MNKFFASIAVAASAFALASCSNDELVAEGGANAPVDGQMYTRLTLQLPQAGRSTTEDWNGNTNSSDGYEIGQDRENAVGSVLVVLTDKDCKPITSNLADPHATTATGNRPTYNVQFETRALYDKAEEEIYVFAFCNPTTKLVEAAEKNFQSVEGGFKEFQGLITDGSISGDNAFLMSNASITKSKLPSQTDMDETYNTPEKPWFLGVVDVARATARFDFKETNNNRYAIYNHNNTDVEGENPDAEVKPSTEIMGYVQLDGMALMNEALNYYFLPRVSEDGFDSKAEICGRELPWVLDADNEWTGGSYVVSPNAGKKVDPLSLDFINGFYRYAYPTTDDKNNLVGMDFTKFDYEPLSTSLGDDYDENWGPGMSDEEKKDYKIWKYVTENTFPGQTINEIKYGAQRKGITTGVVFKGHIEAEAGTKLAEAMDGINIIYAYNGILMGSFQMLKEAVVASPASTFAEKFKAAYNITTEITKIEDLADCAEGTLTGADGFAIYRPENGQYPVYYPYYNRHNDNDKSTVMGPMEFATVRNNIYKLSVTKVVEFGHPGKPGDDPDPEDPDDPDETPKTYFRVQVRVLPWVVRVNNIIL